MSAISQLGVGSIPRWANWEYDNAAARTGASGFVATDVGKIAKQTDTGTFWELTAVTPTWAQVGGGSNLQVDITVNAEVGDIIAIDVQVQDSSGNNVAAMYSLDVLLSDVDTAPEPGTPPDGFNVDTGTGIFDQITDVMKKAVTDATGYLELSVEKTGAATWYLWVFMPDGTLAVSDAITFAA